MDFVPGSTRVFPRSRRQARTDPIWCSHPPADVADDGLATFVDGDMLHLDRLLTAGAVFLEGLDLARERTRELVQHGRGAVLLGNGVDVIEAAGGHHGGIVDRCHLRSQQGLRLVPGIDARSPLKA